jgi:nitroreductase
MEVKEAIKKRVSIRRYTNKKVTEKQINQILESARLAPSGKNRQPWRFIILEDKMKNQVADIMEIWGNENNDKFMVYTTKAIRQSPVFILVYRKAEKGWDTTDLLSIGAALQNMCLTAADLGLGSLWIGYVCEVEEAINKLLKINDLKLTTALSIGYADESPEPRPRLELEDLLLK